MANAEIKEAIRSVIKPNDVKGITAEDLANVLELMVDGCEPSSGGGDSNTFYLYGPISLDYEDETMDGYKRILDVAGVVVPEEIREMWYELIDSWIAHNKESYIKINEEAENGRDVNIVMIQHTMLVFFMVIYILQLQEPEDEQLTPEDVYLAIEECLLYKTYLYPQMVSINDAFGGIQYYMDNIGFMLTEEGEWERNGEREVNPLELYCENENGRLTEDDCKANKYALDYPMSYNKFTIWEPTKDGVARVGHYYILIEKSAGTEDNFPTLEGGVATRSVTRYKYMDGLDMYEVQIANDDYYGRKVRLGTIQLV